MLSAAAAADARIAELWERNKQQRLAGQRALLRIATEGTTLREGLSKEAAADVLFAVGSPEVCRLLVVDRAWSPARFDRWYAETLERLLLPPPSIRRARHMPRRSVARDGHSAVAAG